MGKLVYTEANLIKSCKSRLDWYERLGLVIWWDRYNSGKMNINGRWIQMCRPGTPDLIAYVVKNNYISVCFFECKTSDKSIVQESQKEFQFRWKSIKNVFYKIITHPNQIDQIIELITKNSEEKLNELSMLDLS